MIAKSMVFPMITDENRSEVLDRIALILASEDPLWRQRMQVAERKAVAAQQASVEVSSDLLLKQLGEVCEDFPLQKEESTS